jgi:hypothetical protein
VSISKATSSGAASSAGGLEDVVGDPLLDEYHAMISSRPCHVVVLVPSIEAVATREAGRADKGYVGRWTIQKHHDEFVATTPRLGLWLDTTDQLPEETVDEILRAAPQS